MKIALNRSSPRFWLLYLVVQFCFLLILLFFIRWLWAVINGKSYVIDFAEISFEAGIYADTITLIKLIRYYIGKKRWEKNPVDRRRNHMFRE